MDHRNKKGFTIIEALIALVILTVLLIGLLSSLIVVYEYHKRNLLRDEAVKIAYEYAEIYRNKDLSSISGSINETIRKIIAGTKVNYKVDITVSDVSDSLKKININVKWKYKGKNYSHNIEMLVGENG